MRGGVQSLGPTPRTIMEGSDTHWAHLFECRPGDPPLADHPTTASPRSPHSPLPSRGARRTAARSAPRPRASRLTTLRSAPSHEVTRIKIDVRAGGIWRSSHSAFLRELIFRVPRVRRADNLQRRHLRTGTTARSAALFLVSRTRHARFRTTLRMLDLIV